MGYIGSDPKTNEAVNTAQLVDDSVTNAKIVDNIQFTSVTASVISASSTVTADSFTGTFNGALSSSAQIATNISGSLSSTAIANLGAGIISGAAQLPNGTVSASVLSSPSQGTVRLATNGVNTDVDTGLQVGDSPTFAGGTISGDFSVGGKLTAEEFHTEFTSASITFTSGSHKFGDTSDDSHSMTGSLNISGSLGINDGNVHIVDKMIIGSGSGFDFGNTNHSFTVKSSGNNAGFSVLSSAGGELLRFIQESNDSGKLDMYDGGSLKLRLSAHASENNYINNDGKVGIGTNNPVGKLQIRDTTTGTVGETLTLDTNQTLGGRGTMIRFTGNNRGFVGAEIQGRIEVDSQEKMSLLFVTNNGSATSETMRVTHDGKVGIGTNNPLADLHVSGSNGKILMSDHGQVTLEMQTNDTAAIFQRVLGSTNTSDINGGIFMVGNDTANEVTFHVNYGGGNSGNNYNRRLRLTQTSASFDNCTVGIGTTAPNADRLSLYQAGSTVANSRTLEVGYSVESSAGINGEQYMATILNTNNNAASNGLAIGVKHDDAHALIIGKHDETFDHFCVNGDGEVGIGTLTPGGVLDIWLGSSRLFQVQGDGVGVGNNNPGNYGTFHVTGVGDTSITGSTFYDGYGEINVSGNVIGPHVMCLSSTAEQSTSDYGIQNMGPSMIFRGQPGNGLDGGATFAAIAGTFDASNSTYAAQGNLRFFTSAGYTFNPYYGTEMVERMRIDSGGHIYMTSQRDDLGFNQDGLAIGDSNGVFAYFERSAGTANSILYLHRRNGDGQHISFYESNTQDGYIQTSSGVVSLVGFQGSHEASGIPIDTPTGTVVSTIDEEFKYRHANVKISDTVGDKRVYGVVENFNEEQNDDTGITHPAHFNIASVGVGHIRVTGSCAGGDLLESNGDGLAKVQDDDIIRSKTIGKVTANVSGSATEDRLVACVLYCG